jgi:uncharacterized protein (DUF608 family)
MKRFSPLPAFAPLVRPLARVPSAAAARAHPARVPLALALALAISAPALFAQHIPNGPYRGRNLDRVAFPIGGIGAGMFCIEGTGALSHLSVRHRMDFFNTPACFAAITVSGAGDDGAGSREENIARVLEGPVPEWKFFGARDTGFGSPGTTLGLPRFRSCEFLARFPFATISLGDPALPLDARLTAWSPFTPPDADSSSLPAGAIEYTFVNKTDRPVRAVFSFNTCNFMDKKGAIGALPGGFILHDSPAAGGGKRGAFAVFADGEENTIVDHCWFRGGWWDALTIAWENVATGRFATNPPVPDNAPGATLAVPFELPARGEKTIRLLFAWHVPETRMSEGSRRSDGPALRGTTSRGTVTAKGQQPVTGFLGGGLVNTFDPDGDAGTGTLISSPFDITKKHMHFLIGGGENCAFELVRAADNKVLRTASGAGRERLEWASWDVSQWPGERVFLRIVDRQTGGWGHINLDHVVFSDESIDRLRTAGADNMITNDPRRVVVFDDFERNSYSPVWTAVGKGGKGASPLAYEDPLTGGQYEVPEYYIPWYATKFASVGEVAETWRRDYDKLRAETQKFTGAFYDSTLPPEVVEAVAANLTILKTPTVLRQHDGRIWCWEGCGDDRGSCHGSCTHVWNYAQALCHLFPALERSLRQTEYFESSDGTGRQAFRANLPISPGGTNFDAADGQLGGIMKIYREWRVSGDDRLLRIYWPLAKRSMDYMIAKYDPRRTGLPEESQHNTYDINWSGPNGHCGSFYIGALAALCELGAATGADVSDYETLVEKGRKRMREELYNGEYFVQIIRKGNARSAHPAAQSEAYRAVAETVSGQGPKYQYGNGCLSDGALGFWMARMCGLDAPLLDEELVRSHLLSVYKYNMRHDLSAHANPQRPGYALGDDGGLLLCTWPRGGKPLLPFVYSDEVWTGIEYQVAGHLMLLGHADEGLDIVRTLRKRYDGARRNPFNEYECGHWYARAMASYGLLQGMTGVRYDARSRTLHAGAGDFRVFLSTATGFGVVARKGGVVSVDVRSGKIAVDKIGRQ